MLLCYYTFISGYYGSLLEISFMEVSYKSIAYQDPRCMYKIAPRKPSF